MAAGKIDIITRLMMEDGDFNSKSQSVLKMLKKISTTDTLIKLKFDDKDFRRELQKELDSASQELRKAMHIKQGKAITYKNDKGETKDVNTEASIRRLQEFALKQSSNNALSTKERNYWNTVREAAEGYLSTINKTREAIKEVDRLNRAKLSGRVQATREQAAKEERARINEAKNNLKNEEKSRAAADREAASVRAAQSKRVYDQQAKQDEQQRKALEAANKKAYDLAARQAITNGKLEDVRLQKDANYKENYGKDNLAYLERKLALEREELGIRKEIDRLNSNGRKSAETRDVEKQIRETSAALKVEKQHQQELKKVASLTKQIDDIERRRLDNQKMTVNANQRIQNEIGLLQQKLAKLRKIDRIQNNGKASAATLAAESQLRNLQHTNGLLQQQGGILGRLKGLATQYLSIFAVWNFGKKIVETTGYFEQQKVALEGILGSAADAEKAFTRMQKMALQSPFELKDIVGQTKQAAAYGIGDGDTKKLLDDVKMLGDLSAGLGVDMQRLILAYGQVKAAAVLRGQELRQFTEAGIPMVQALADKFTQLNGKLVTTGEVFELISRRQVSFEMVASVMRDMTADGGKFNNMQEKITETLYGQVQKLKDMWTQSMNSIGSGLGGALMNVVKALQWITKHAGSLMKGGMIIALYSAMKKIGPQLILLKENAVSTANAFRFMRDQVNAARTSFEANRIGANRLKKSFVVLKATAKGLGAIFASLGTAGLVAVVGAIHAVVSAAKDAKREFGRTMADIDKSFNKDLTRMTDGLDSLISKIRTFSQGTKAYNDAIDSLKSNYGEYVNDAIIQQLQSETDSAYNASKAWLAMRDSIEAAIKARNEYERHTAKAEASGSKIEERATKEEFSFLKFWQRGKSEVQRQLEYINNGVLQGESGASYVDKFKTKESQDKVNNVIKASMSDFFASEGTTFEEFKESVEKNAKLHAPEMADAMSDLAIRFFNVFASDEQFDFYKKEVEAKANSPYALNEKALEDARKKAADNLEGRWAGTTEEYRSRNDLSKAYDPFEWNKKEDELYIEAAKTRMIDIYKSITDEMKGEGFAEAGKALTDAFNMDWDTSKTYAIADAMHKYAEAINDPELKSNIEHLRGLLVDFAGTKTGIAAQISTNIEKDFMSGADVSARQKDFFNKYNPNDQNVNSLREQLVKEYQTLDAAVKSHKNPKGEWKKIVDDYKEEMKWLEMLAGSRYYDVDLTKNKGGGSKPRFTDFINDMLQVIINADKDVKKIAQVTGYTGAMTDFVNELGNDNTTKKFFTLGANPFEDIFSKMAQYGIDTKMVKGLDKNILTTILKEVGWEEGKTMSLPDFKAMYEGLIKNLSDKVVPLITDERERTNVEKYLGNALFKSPFGRNEIEDKLKAMVASLQNIEKYSEQEAIERGQYDRLRKAMNYEDAYKLVYGKDKSDKRYYDSREGASRDLLALFEAAGGSGESNTLLGEDLVSLLKKQVTLDVQSLKFLNDAKKRLQDQYNVMLKNADPNDKEQMQAVEQFSKVSDKFNKAIDKLINSVIEYEEKRPRSKNEKKEIELQGIYHDFRDKIQMIDIENDHNVSNTLIDTLNDYFDKLARSLGGTGNLGFVKSGTTMSVAAQNFLGGMSGQTNLLQRIGNSTADKLQKGEIKADQAAAIMSNASASIALVDAIIKAVYGAIKAITDAMKATTKLMKSFNKIYAYEDKNGNTRFQKRYDEHTLEKTEKVADTIQEYNQHVMDGWEKAKNNDILGSLMEIYTSITDLITSINGILDSDIDKLIKDNNEDIKSLDKTINRTEWNARYTSGIDKMNTRGDELNKYWEKYQKLIENYNLEMEKKSGDSDAAEKFKDEAEQTKRELIDLVQEIREEVLGTADELSSSLTDAFVNAFKNGTNAARDWASAVKEYMGQVLQTMLLDKVLAPRIQSVFDEWMGGTSEQLAEMYKDSEGKVDQKALGDYYLSRMEDENAGKKAQRDLYALGDWMTDMYEGFGQWTKDMIAFNADTTSLSGGIQGMTEDTGRTLEGLGNSILMQHVMTNQKLDEIKILPFAQVQTSWFKDMLMQSQAIATATADMRNAIADMRNGVRPLYVTMQ